MNRASKRALQAAIVATGAPLGWLLLRTMRGASPYAELRDHGSLYGYMLGGTVGAFSAFGYLLGGNEQRLLETNRMLDARAITDSLTGLRNRGYFWSRLEEEYAAVARGESGLALVLLDIDHFKAVNDRFGHPAGDRVLEMIGEVLSELTRGRETAARVGGEEFALLLPGHTAKEAQRAAERIRSEIAARSVPLDRRGTGIRVTVSGGVAARTAGAGRGCEALYAEADRALYRAKEEGRDRVVVAASPAEQAGD